MFQLYGTTMAGCIFAVSAFYIEWRNRVSAKAGRGKSQVQHLHDSGGDVVDDPAAAAAGRNFGHRCGSAAGRSGGLAAERVSTRAGETDLSPHRRLQSRAAETAEAIMQTSGRRTDPSVARDAEPGRRASELCSGRLVSGVGSQSLVAQSLSAGRKPARSGSLACAAHSRAA